MHVADFYTGEKIVLSFEFMPIRNGEDIDLKIISSAKDLLKYGPSFFTVTQSSSASLRGGNFVIASEMKKKLKVEVMSHMICADKTRSVIENELSEANYLGIKNIMALRGDPPWGEKEFKAKEGGFSYGYELVEEIMKKNWGEYILRGNDAKFFNLDKDAKFRPGTKTDFCVCVAGYPEGHRECKDRKLSIIHLKQKIDAGAKAVFTQMFYDATHYFEFVKDCRKAGIKVPIIPGIMPITFYGQVNFLKNTCAVNIPEEYLNEIEVNKDDEKKIIECSVKFTINLCRELLKKGVPGLHFYTLNNPKPAVQVLDCLSLKQA
jgi:methylenetetrahydrofolate reductase (NADPH)